MLYIRITYNPKYHNTYQTHKHHTESNKQSCFATGAGRCVHRGAWGFPMGIAARFDPQLRRSRSRSIGPPLGRTPSTELFLRFLTGRSLFPRVWWWWWCRVLVLLFLVLHPPRMTNLQQHQPLGSSLCRLHRRLRRLCLLLRPFLGLLLRVLFGIRGLLLEE